MRDESAAGADRQVQVSAHPAHPGHSRQARLFHAFFPPVPLAVSAGLHLLSAQAPSCAAQTRVDGDIFF